MTINNNTKEVICTLCPLGCKMLVTKNTGEEDSFTVRGQKCGKGRGYAIKEFLSPVRTLTTTVLITNTKLTRLPVKTKDPIPKHLVKEAADKLAQLEVKGPVKMGEVILPNLLGSGSDVIATRSMA